MFVSIDIDEFTASTRLSLLCALASGCHAFVAGEVYPDPSACANVDPAYDEAVLADGPVGFWDVCHSSGREPDLTGNDNFGIYHGGTLVLTTLPNGDPVVDFDGAREYLAIPSRPSLSIPTTGNLTWEAWIRPDGLQFANSPRGYVNWMGKCASYSPTCEWEARMYNATNAQGRCNRLSAYVFNPDGGNGAGADWQPVCDLFRAGAWHHVVGEYTTARQPSTCPITPAYPGSINIWVDGVEWNQLEHNPTGCMSQYNVVPAANRSPVLIGTSALDNWFAGAIGKVAIYDYLLDTDQIASHYTLMTGIAPRGNCGEHCTIP